MIAQHGQSFSSAARRLPIRPMHLCPKPGLNTFKHPTKVSNVRLDQSGTPDRPRARGHDPAGRRVAVLAAARTLFAARGYEKTSVRAIAAMAGVNQAQVVGFFGGKESLFLEVVGDFCIVEDDLHGPEGLSAMGAQLARLYLDRWEHQSAEDPWPALVRSALSHETSDRVLRSAIEQQVTGPLSRLLGDSAEGRVRHALVKCLLVGMIMDRYVHAQEPTRSLPVSAFEPAFAAALQHAIDGPLPPTG